MVTELQQLINKVWQHCEASGNRGRTVTLKIKFADFEIISRSQSSPGAVSNRANLENVSVTLLRKSMPLLKSVRLLGLSLSGLQTQDVLDQSQMMLLL
jgi:DNA polymerase IV